MEEITAVYIRERLRFQSTDGDTIIADIRLVNGSGDLFSDALPIAVKGKADVDELQPHQTYRFYGRGWSDYTNKRTGRTEHQFAFQTFVRSQPFGRAGVISYLKQAGRGHGIGQARATMLWEKFGSDAVRILREEPEVAAAAVAGLSVGSATEAARWLEEEHALEGCTIDLIDLLAGRGFPKDTARKAVRLWGNRAAEIIKRDCFRLMSFRGCGFKRCDALWMELGLPASRLRRQALCAWYTIASNTDGHTWFPVDYCVQGLRQQIGGADVRPVAAIKLAKKIGQLSLDRNGALSTLRSDADAGVIVPAGGKLWVAEGRKAWNEDKLAELIVASFGEVVRWPDVDQVRGIDQHQRKWLAHSLRGSVGILGGGPGTGKTFTAASLIALLVEQVGANEIGIGCPTGKAAVRMTEALTAYGLPLRARTWHSLLGIGQTDAESGNWGFKHDENNPLPFKVLIGDESSMLDTNLMCSIFRARAAGTLFLLVGDINQLPPVGHGAPLRDLIRAGLPYGELREIKRNSGGIVEACAAIRDGRRWEAGDNLQLFEHAEPEWQIKRLVQLLRAAKDDGFDPVWDCQTVVAVNAKSKLSRKDVNKALQEELNKHPEIKGQPFRLGDKIVCLKNGFYQLFDHEDLQASEIGETQINERGEVFVANGELAEVIDVAEKLIVAKLSSPTRTIKIPRGRSQETDDGGQDGGENGTSSTGCSWDLGYALSVHKSQGSEWPVVLVLIDEYPGARMVCDRSWLYTAISRAKKRCVLIGRKATAERFCRQQKMGRRKTFLKQLIALKTAELTLVEL